MGSCDWTDGGVRPYVSIAANGFLFASFTISNSLLLRILKLCIAGLSCLFLLCARRLRTLKSLATSFWCGLVIFASLLPDFTPIFFWGTGRSTRSWALSARRWTGSGRSFICLLCIRASFGRLAVVGRSWATICFG